LPCLLLGLAGTALLTAVPGGTLEQVFSRPASLAPLKTGLVAVPLYLSPAQAVRLTGEVLVAGGSLGPALILFILGTGLNLGGVSWTLRAYGLRLAGAFLAIVVLAVIGLGYAVQGVSPAAPAPRR